MVKRAYRHTQIGYFLIVAYCTVIVVMGVLTFIADYRRFVVIGLLVIVIALNLFATLTVSVSDHGLRLRFGIGVIRKQFPISEIATCRVVRNPWYYGWGIRYTPRGWLYSVSGLDAAELEMRNGKRVRIGTDTPQELAAALEVAIRQHNEE